MNFKVGDRVRSRLKPFLVGIITEIEKGVIRSYFPYLVVSDHGDKAWYPVHDLTLVDASIGEGCTCGGFTVGSHSGWCDDPTDNKPRNRGLTRKVTR